MPEFVERYAKDDALYPAEERILDLFRQQFSGSVLDVAVGAGRTTRAILPACRRYVGIDFSEGMVRAAKQRFPAAELRTMDMRDVPNAFSSDRFDAILISFNGIDYLQWEDRNVLLSALRKLLAPNGVLVFSTHDLTAAAHERGFHLPQDLQIRWDTLRRPRALARIALRLPPWVIRAGRNHLRYRRLERTGDGYAYVNDLGEEYGLLTTYVSTAKQIELLMSCGYERIEMLQPWLRDEPAYFNYFTCRAG